MDLFFSIVYCILVVAMIIVFVIDIYVTRPRHEVVIDDEDIFYLRKRRKMYHILGYDEHYVYIEKEYMQKYAIPNRDILCLDLLHSDFYCICRNSKKAGD